MSRTASREDCIPEIAQTESESASNPFPDPETLQLVTDEKRRDIVLALWESDGTSMSFSTLRREVGITDSALFNYHLQKLVGTLLAKNNGQYELSKDGKQLMLALAAAPD